MQPSEAGAVEFSGLEDDTYRARIRVEKPGYALFKMTYRPNWRAAIDGKRAQTVMLSPGFIGVAVQPGSHLIELRYEPSGLTGWLLMGSIAAVAAAALIERRSKIL